MGFEWDNFRFRGFLGLGFGRDNFRFRRFLGVGVFGRVIDFGFGDFFGVRFV